MRIGRVCGTSIRSMSGNAEICVTTVTCVTNTVFSEEKDVLAVTLNKIVIDLGYASVWIVHPGSRVFQGRGLVTLVTLVSGFILVMVIHLRLAGAIEVHVDTALP